ncbi:protein kinase [Candidatus Uabimicrobium sp. HlEnr_7]|uniref:protein kinase domain-containing protein n=1 Tax=Candidatus Uabimicrobium helgolandensis TaxID=3095367 RepID=UPI003558269E
MRIVDEIKNYEIVERLNRGRFSTVYKAIEKSTKQQVIVRVVHDSVFKTNYGLKRWKQFIEKTILLEAPYFVKMISLGEIENQIYYVTEYCKGQTLYDILQKNISLDDFGFVMIRNLVSVLYRVRVIWRVYRKYIFKTIKTISKIKKEQIASRIYLLFFAFFTRKDYFC